MRLLGRYSFSTRIESLSTYRCALRLQQVISRDRLYCQPLGWGSLMRAPGCVPCVSCCRMFDFFIHVDSAGVNRLLRIVISKQRIKVFLFLVLWDSVGFCEAEGIEAN